MTTPAQMQARFWRFHLAHPNVYTTLVDITREWVRMRGFKPGGWSVWSAYAVARWQRGIKGLPDPEESYKMTNDFTTFYSRLIMAHEPDLDGLFVVRESKYAPGFDPYLWHPGEGQQNLL